MLEALGIHDFPVFVISAVTLALTPGQDTLYVLGRSAAQGRTAGFVSVAGILSGALVHIIAGAAGLSALLAASPSAFAIVRTAGGIYLVYLGVRLLIAKSEENAGEEGFSAKEGAVTLWRQGALTNLLNPKVALFCLAFIPQFIHPEAPGKAMAFLVLGLCFFFIGSAWLMVVAWSASAIRGKLRGGRGFPALLNRLAGVLFLVLGLRLLFAA